MKRIWTALLLSFLLAYPTVYADNTKRIPYPQGYDIKSSGASSAYGLADVDRSPYFRAPDFYNMKSNNKGLHILSQYKTYQQTTETTCGAAVALMVLYNYSGLYSYDAAKFDELQISDRIGTKHERDNNGEIGTSTKQLVDFFEGLGWEVISSLQTGNSEGYSFADIGRFAKFVEENIKAGRPIMVESMYWGGHWRIIIGYDTLGTEDMTDDVLIFADPYDTQDHRQDGYTTQTLAGFYYTWKDVDMLPKDQRVQQWIVAQPR